jgi:predicted nuclease of restriction endonuclease-like (RecB) superfamily
MAKRKEASGEVVPARERQYAGLLDELSSLLETGRQTAARAVNAILAATYWEVGRRIVEFEQGGKQKADYGTAVIDRLAADLTARFGRGFSRSNLFQIRAFYSGWQIVQTPSGLSQVRAKLPPPEQGDGISPGPAPLTLQPMTASAGLFPLPWSHYVRLLSVENTHARQFYEEEAIRGGWSVRQLDRQVSSLFYERTALSKNKAAMLAKGQSAKAGDSVTVEEQVRDPYVLEFLGLKDEYAESDLEEAIIHHLETFLLELGDDFTFVGRQKRLRLDDEWYKVDLVFFHRGLRCLLLIELKIGKLTHADAGQMNLYLNYARANWVREGENPPVGLILCAEKGHDVARYALEALGNKVLASTYRMTLPDEKVIAAEIEKTRRALELTPPSRKKSD